MHLIWSHTELLENYYILEQINCKTNLKVKYTCLTNW